MYLKQSILSLFLLKLYFDLFDLFVLPYDSFFWYKSILLLHPQLPTLHNCYLLVQVHPYKLTNALLGAAAELVGSPVRYATVTGIATEADRVIGVKLDGGDVLPADVVVLAMGPWTSQAACWISGLTLPITGDPVHSILLKPEAQISADMLFTRYQTDCKTTDPEVSSELSLIQS